MKAMKELIICAVGSPGPTVLTGFKERQVRTRPPDATDMNNLYLYWKRNLHNRAIVVI